MSIGGGNSGGGNSGNTGGNTGNSGNTGGGNSGNTGGGNSGNTGGRSGGTSGGGSGGGSGGRSGGGSGGRSGGTSGGRSGGRSGGGGNTIIFIPVGGSGSDRGARSGGSGSGVSSDNDATLGGTDSLQQPLSDQRENIAGTRSCCGFVFQDAVRQPGSTNVVRLSTFLGLAAELAHLASFKLATKVALYHAGFGFLGFAVLVAGKIHFTAKDHEAQERFNRLVNEEQPVVIDAQPVAAPPLAQPVDNPMAVAVDGAGVAPADEVASAPPLLTDNPTNPKGNGGDAPSALDQWNSGADIHAPESDKMER